MNMMSPIRAGAVEARLPEISKQIWDEKYRLKTLEGEPIDLTIEDSWRRAARALAAVEADPAAYEAQFY